MKLPLGKGAYNRTSKKRPAVVLENRYFEEDPTNLVDGTVLLSRPATKNVTGFGAGPIRANWSQDGTFNGDLFVVSGDALFRYSQDGLTKTQLVGTIQNSPAEPSIDGTDEYVFISDGTTLQYYNGVGNFATSTLTFTGLPADGEQVTLGTATYTFNTTLGGANSVLIGATSADCVDNLVAAVNLGEGIGSTYGVGTLVNADATGEKDAGDNFRATAKLVAADGNSVATAETIVNASWEGSTLSGGTAQALIGIPTPDDVAIVSLAVIGGFVLCVTAEDDRVYFIRPEVGNTLPNIDPLDFFEAERLPDQIHSVKVVGDGIWFFGEDTTEVWYLSGVGTVPFDRIKGRSFARGIIPGTDVEIDNRLYVVGKDMVVYEAQGGLQRVSTHGIEEQIRLTLETERDAS